MNVFVTASNKKYKKACDYCVYAANHFGKFDKVLAYDIDTMIDDNYREQHKDIFQTKRGAGLWLWKVYFIRKALLEECEEGDILFYADAASFFFRSAIPLLNKFKGDVFVSKLPFIEEEFTKGEVFKIMGLTSDYYTKTNQYHASFLAFRKNTFTVQFVNEWIHFCEDIKVISPIVFCGNQMPFFVEHRNDQSVFSLLCKKYKISPSEDPSERGVIGYKKYKKATYVPLEKTKTTFCIMLHKRSDLNGLLIMKYWLKIFKIIFLQKINK